MKEIKSIYTKDEAGVIVATEVSVFVSGFSREHSVADYEHLSGENVVSGLVTLVASDADLPDEAAGYAKEHGLLKEIIKDSLKLEGEFNKLVTAAKAESEQAKKEEANQVKLAKEDLTNRQNIFLTAAANAITKADDSLSEQLVDLRNHMPNGIGLHVTDDGGFSMEFADDVKEEDIASALGYLVGQESNNEKLKGAYQFLIGELANYLVGKGVYPSMIQCGKALSDRVKTQGFTLTGRGIESYARMAARIPEALRNPRADSTAYLMLSDMPYPKKPSKAEYPDKAQLGVATKEWEVEAAKVDEKRLELAAHLKKGTYTSKLEDGSSLEVEMLTKRQIMGLVDKAKIDLGLKKETEDKKTATFWLRQYFEACEYFELFQGVHTKDAIVVKLKEGDGTKTLKLQDCADMKEEAKRELTVVFFGDKLPAYQAGTEDREVQVFETVEGKQVKKADKDGKLIKETKSFKVYPIMYSLD